MATSGAAATQSIILLRPEGTVVPIVAERNVPVKSDPQVSPYHAQTGDVDDRDLSQSSLESVFTADQLEEAGATRKMLYSSRASVQWLAIGSSLARVGNTDSADSVARFVRLLSDATTPHSTVELVQILSAERGLLDLLRLQPLDQLKVRGGTRSISASLGAITEANRDMEDGHSESIERKQALLVGEVDKPRVSSDYDRKPGRGWSSDPGEYSEEAADRALPHIENPRPTRGIETGPWFSGAE